jgi:hypothetical protein
MALAAKASMMPGRPPLGGEDSRHRGTAGRLAKHDDLRVEWGLAALVSIPPGPPDHPDEPGGAATRLPPR